MHTHAILANVAIDEPLSRGSAVRFSYPEDTNRATFYCSSHHTLGVGGTFFSSPRDFQLLFHEHDIELIWLRSRRLPGKTVLNISLENPYAEHYTDRRSGITVKHLIPTSLFTVAIGIPNPADPAYVVRTTLHHTDLVFDGDVTMRHPRTLTLQGSQDMQDVLLRVEGEDYYHQPMVETIQGPALYAVAEGNKAFSRVRRIEASRPLEMEILAGTSNRLGFPVFIHSAGVIMSVLVNGDPVTGFTITPGESNLATDTTGDRRGLLTMPPELQLDGHKMLHVTAALVNPANIGSREFSG